MENQISVASQFKAARLVGLLYLIAMATGLFAEFYVRFPTLPNKDFPLGQVIGLEITRTLKK